MIEYGLAVKAAREAQGRTQREVATALGIHAPYVCLIEKGKQRPGPELAARFAALLGVPDPPAPRPPRGRRGFEDGPPPGTRESVAYAARFVTARLRYRGVLIDRLVDALDREPHDAGLVPAARRVAYCGYYRGASIDNLNYVLGVYAARQGMGLR